MIESSNATRSKISRSKSPKRKNKSLDRIKLKNSNSIGVRSKFGGSFESMKKSSGGDAFNYMNMSQKGNKENHKENQFLKKKKLVYAYLKA